MSVFAHRDASLYSAGFVWKASSFGVVSCFILRLERSLQLPRGAFFTLPQWVNVDTATASSKSVEMSAHSSGLPLAAFSVAKSDMGQQSAEIWTSCLQQLALAALSGQRDQDDSGQQGSCEASLLDSNCEPPVAAKASAKLHHAHGWIELGPQNDFCPPHMRSYLLHAAVSIMSLELVAVLQAAVQFATQEQCCHCFTKAQLCVLRSFLVLPASIQLFVSSQVWPVWLSGGAQRRTTLLAISTEARESLEQLSGQALTTALQWVCVPVAVPGGTCSLQCTASASEALHEATVVWAGAAVGSTNWVSNCSWQLLSVIYQRAFKTPKEAPIVRQHTSLASVFHIQALERARQFHAACAMQAAEAIAARNAALKDDTVDFPDAVAMLCAPLGALFRWSGSSWDEQPEGMAIVSSWANGKGKQLQAADRATNTHLHPFLSRSEWALALTAHGATPASRVWTGACIVARTLLRLGQRKMGIELLEKLARWPNKHHWFGAHEVYSSVLLLWVGALKRSSSQQHRLQWQEIAAAATSSRCSPQMLHLEAQDLLQHLASDPQQAGTHPETAAAGAGAGQPTSFEPLWPACEPQHSQLLQILHADPFASKPKQLKRSRSAVASPPQRRRAFRARGRGRGTHQGDAHSQGAVQAPSPASSKASFDAAAVPSVKLLVSRWQQQAPTGSVVTHERAAVMALLPTAHTGALASLARQHRLECNLGVTSTSAQGADGALAPKAEDHPHTRRQAYSGLCSNRGCTVEECALQMMCNIFSPCLLSKDVECAAARAITARVLQATSYTPEVVQAMTRWGERGGYPLSSQQKGEPSPAGLLGWRGIHAENGLWRSLKVLCVASLLVDSTSRTLQIAPFCSSWGSCAFAVQHRVGIGALLQKLRGMLPCQTAEWIFRQHHKYKDCILPGMQWQVYSAELLSELVHCMCSGPMGSIPLADWLQYALEEAPGIEVGYPDLVLWLPGPCPAACKWAQLFSQPLTGRREGSVDPHLSESTQVSFPGTSQSASRSQSQTEVAGGSVPAVGLLSPPRGTQQPSGHSMSTPGSSIWGASSDALGHRPVVWSGTRFAALEVKSASDSMRDAQRMWMYWLSQHPGFTAGIVHVGLAAGTDERRSGKRSRLFKP